MLHAPSISKRSIPVLPRFLTRPQLLTRLSSLPWEGHLFASVDSVPSAIDPLREGAIMVTHHRQLITGLAVLALLLVGTFRAEAQDVRIHPGTMCVPVDPPLVSVAGQPVAVQVLAVDPFDAPPFPGIGQVCNLTDSNVEVSCPIVRINNERTWDDAQVFFEDRNPGFQVNPACRAFNFEQTRGVMEFPLQGPPLPADATGLLTINFGGLPSSQVAEGIFFLSCILPPDVCLRYYQVDEVALR